MTPTPDLFGELHPHSSVTQEEIREASVLRSVGLSYPAIAQVMGRYHQAWYSPDTWRQYLRRIGHPGTKKTLPRNRQVVA